MKFVHDYCQIIANMGAAPCKQSTGQEFKILYSWLCTKGFRLPALAPFSIGSDLRRWGPKVGSRGEFWRFLQVRGYGRNVVHEITAILNRAGKGDTNAASQLLPLVYEELRKLASARMARESGGNTLQATALVHEAWLRLGGDVQPTWQNRAHFFAAAAEAMRRILIDGARRRHANRHGGGLQRLDVNDSALEIAAPCGADDELLAVHEALESLAIHDARKAELVKLRYFAGFTLEQAAEALGISVPTAKRDWTYARAWLFKEINQRGGG